jgi:hypothetical protein
MVNLMLACIVVFFGGILYILLGVAFAIWFARRLERYNRRRP